MRDGQFLDVPMRSTRAMLRAAGRDLPITSLRVRREIVGDLPWQLTGGGGFAAGQLDAEVVAPEPAVQSAAPSPLRSPDTMLAGRPVEAYIGDVRGPLHRWASMRVESVSGSATTNAVAVSASDDLRRLSSDWWFDPLLATMPPLKEGGDYRRIGLLNTAVTHLMLRHLGRTCTPRASTAGADAIVDAPMMGSLLTKAGTVVRAEWDALTRVPTSWGIAVGGFVVTYDFPGDITEKSLGLVVSTANQPEGGAATVEFSTVQGTAWKLTIARTYVVIKDRLDNEITSRLPHTGEGRVGVECRWSGDSAAFVVRSSQTTQTATGTGTLTTATVARLCRAFTDGPGLLGSITVIRDPAHVSALMADKPNAVMHMHINDTHPLRAMPTQQGTDPATLLQEQSEADCSAMWVDGDDVWHIAGREWLRNQSVKATYTSENSLSDWSWEAHAGANPSAVSISSSMPAITRSRWYDVTLWEGSGGTLDEGASTEEWLTPESGVDWVEPDITGASAHSPANAGDVNRGRGTILGAHWVDAAGNGDSLGPAWSDGGGVLEKIAPGTWRWATAWQSDPPKAGAAIAMAIDPDRPGIAKRWQGNPLPIFRGAAKVEWRDRTTGPYPVPGARRNTRPLEHNVGWWVQDTTALTRLGEFLAARGAEGLLRVSGVRIVPDWRLELGDMIEVVDSITRVKIKGIVAELDVAVAGGGSDASMTLAVRPVAVTSLGATVGDVDTAHMGRTVAQADARYDALTVGQVDADPITPAL